MLKIGSYYTYLWWNATSGQEMLGLTHRS